MSKTVRNPYLHGNYYFFEKFIFVRDDLDILDLIRIKEEGGISEVLHIHAILAGFEARRVPEL